MGLCGVWGGKNWTIGDDREVYLVLLSGEFTFVGRGRRSHTNTKMNHMQLQIDATTAQLHPFGHISDTKKYYDDPSLLDAFALE
jgi:hypothetical protein